MLSLLFQPGVPQFLQAEPHPGFDGTQRQRQVVGNFGLAHSAKITEFDDLALLCWQIVYCKAKAVDTLTIPPIVGKMKAGDFLRVFKRAISGCLNLPPTLAEVINGEIARDTDQPGDHRATLVVELGGILPGFHENILDNLFRTRCLIEHSVSDTIKKVCVTCVKRDHRFLIFAFDSTNQRQIVHSWPCLLGYEKSLTRA